jgi:hypothetical protein
VLAENERSSGTIARRVGSNSEVGWERVREVCWWYQRGALAKIERCAGKDYALTSIIAFTCGQLKSLSVFTGVVFLIAFNKQLRQSHDP